MNFDDLSVREQRLYCEHQAAFHSNATIYYAKQNLSRLASWASEQAALWRAKNVGREAREQSDDVGA